MLCLYTAVGCQEERPKHSVQRWDGLLSQEVSVVCISVSIYVFRVIGVCVCMCVRLFSSHLEVGPLLGMFDSLYSDVHSSMCL